MRSSLIRRLLDFCRSNAGSIGVLAGLTLPVLVGVSSLTTELGYGLVVKVENQRMADLAAYSGALAYNSTGSSTSMNAAIGNIAALNGVSSSAVAGTLVSSPSGNGNQAVSVSVATQRLLLLAPVIRSGSTLPVSSASAVEFSPQGSGCITALSGTGTGVTLSGGATVSAPACIVQSNTTVSVPCGTTLTTKAITYNSASAPSQPCGGIVPPSGTSSVKITKTSVTDPLSGNAGVAAAAGRLSSVSALAAPAAPTVPAGTDISFGHSTGSTPSQATSAGCSASLSGSTWTLTCASGGTYKFGIITLAGAITVNFNTTGSGATTYDFTGPIAVGASSTLRFGPGTFDIAQGVTTNTSATVSFGAGTFNIGTASTACSGGRFSICTIGNSTLTFGGPSTFVLQGGMYNSGNSTLTLGSGTTNSFQIGAGSTGDAIYLGSASTTTFADALGGSNVFKVAGNLNVTSGASCLTLSAAAQHDINGNVAAASGTILGAGVYTVNGYVGFGVGGAADGNCSGAAVGVSGSGVTLAISGTSTPASGPCAGTSFCVASGFNHVTLTAPTSGTTANLLLVGPTNAARTGGASFAGGSTTSLSGAMYFPNGPVSMSGGATLGNGAGQCLQIIGSQVSASGGTTSGSTCITGSSSGGTTVLVQ